MKKLILSTLLIVTFSFNVFAQDQGEFEIGVGIGVNFASFFGDDADLVGANTRTSFLAGVTGEYFFNDRWGIKSGLIFDSKGSEFNGGGEARLNYLFIPIYANWHFGRNRGWYLNFGPHVDFLLSAENEDDEDVSDVISSTDVGLGVGIGYKFRLSDSIKLFIEYQAAGGFIPVIDTGDSDDPDFTNTRGGFKVGILF